MLRFDEFAKLRMTMFLPVESITQLEAWEFMDRIWIGEALGFSEWLRLVCEPELLRSLSIDLTEFPSWAAQKALQTVELPISYGYNESQIVRHLGQPVRRQQFVPDRQSLDFTSDGYDISCTIHSDEGLIYLVITHLS